MLEDKMDKLHLLFPIALLAFIVIVFAVFITSRQNTASISDKADKKIGRADRILILIISVCYALCAFINLGTVNNPENFCRFASVGSMPS